MMSEIRNKLFELPLFNLLKIAEKGVLIVNRKGRLIYANQSICRELNMPEAQVLSKSIYEINPQLNVVRWYKDFDKLIRQSVIQEAEIYTNNEIIFKATTEALGITVDGVLLCCYFIDNKNKTNRYKDLLKMTARDAKIGAWEWDLVNRSILLTEEIFNIFEQASSSTFFTKKAFLKRALLMVNKASLRALLVRFDRSVRLGIDFEIDATIENIRGLSKNIIIKGMPIQEAHSEQASKVFGTLQDVSKFKQEHEEERYFLMEELNIQNNLKSIICVSDTYKKVLEQVAKVADIDTTVLITGEVGSGKEILARSIHQLSNRQKQPVFKVNCASLSGKLLDRIMFGYNKKSFIDANESKKGKLEMATNGTFIIKEINEMPLDIQAKLLEAIESQTTYRIGSDKPISIDTRIVATSSKNLEKLVEQGLFRLDLYLRLNLVLIKNIPLRERKEDLPKLVEFFIEKYAPTAHIAMQSIPDEYMQSLINNYFRAPRLYIID